MHRYTDRETDKQTHTHTHTHTHTRREPPLIGIGMAHSFIELCKPLCLDEAVLHEVYHDAGKG